MNLSVEHVLSIVIIVFLLYHFVGRCQCRDSFSVGGQSASPTCKCEYTDCYIPDKSTTLPDVCVSAKNENDCLCNDKANPSSCAEAKGWERALACKWTNCNSITYNGNTQTYTFDLSSLNLNPKNGSVIYEIQNDVWSNISNGNNPHTLKLTDAQLGVLNCLQDQLKIRYIGVNNKGSLWYTYQVLVGINAGEPGADFTFSGPGVDEESLSIDITSILIHDANYNAKNPTITNLIVNQ